jgi:hypothetical protein
VLLVMAEYGDLDGLWDRSPCARCSLRAGLHLAYDLQHELGPGTEVRHHHDGDPRPVSERRGG